MEVFDRIAEIGVLPVIALPTADAAVPLADALAAGGIGALEVTLRTPCALEGIARIRAAHPEMAVGAGTVLDATTLAAAKEAGAAFAVSPGLDPEVVTAARSAGLSFVPGVATPTEIIRAVRLGLSTLKFFPAESSGGVAALKLLHGPFPNVRFLPTGGLSLANIGGYLELPFVAACGGSFMAKADVVRSCDWAKITADCRACLEIVRRSRGGT